MLFTGSRYHGPQRSGGTMIALTDPHRWVTLVEPQAGPDSPAWS
jgi:hypothetical protein